MYFLHFCYEKLKKNKSILFHSIWWFLWSHEFSNLYFNARIFYLSRILIYFSRLNDGELLYAFCFIINYKLFIINFLQDYLSFAVVIIPIEFFNDPSKINVEPYLFSKSKDIPPILQSWKNDPTCLSESPKCKI